MMCHDLTVQQTLKQWQVEKDGLSSERVSAAIAKFGSNRISSGRQTTKVEILLSQFNNPLIFVLLAASAVTGLLKAWSDLITIFAAIFINVILGFIQESRAESSFRLLRNMLSIKARVRRDGKMLEIDSSELVPGDIVLLRSGDNVPADGRLIKAVELETMEASLTGESSPVGKYTDPIFNKEIASGDMRNCVFTGTTVVRGAGEYIVCQTGLNTQLGKITSLLTDSSFDEKTPLQKQLNTFSVQLSVITLFLCCCIFALGLWEGYPWVEMFTLSVAIAVAAIPEGLVVGVTAILAIGMQRILRKNALVRRLVAAETLGCTNIICFDKTGTMTLGEMRLTRVVNFIKDLEGNISSVIGGQEGAAENNKLSFKIAALCNQAFVESQDKRRYVIRGTPTEKGLLLAALESGFTKDDLLEEFPLLEILPFSSERKYAASLHKDGDQSIVFLAGAPEIFLNKASSVRVNGNTHPIDETVREFLFNELYLLSSRGLRVVALGYKKSLALTIHEVDMSTEFVLVSFVCLKDPLRPEIRESLSDCRTAGLRPIIITGDNHLTASAIAADAGFIVNEETILRGEDLHNLSDDELDGRIDSINLYSRINPEDKPRIVQAWQRKGMIVAMIGDGVNDAPAIKIADIGVSLGSGTDVAQSVSDIVLLGDNFSAIVDAIWEGRVIFNNIRKVVLYLLSDSFSELFLVFGSLLFLNRIGGNGLSSLPLSASQILWINLVTDGFPHLALTAEPGDIDVINEPPRDRNEPVANRPIKLMIVLISLFTALFTISIFYISRFWWGYSLEHSRSLVFAALGLDSLLYVFSCRDLKKPVWQTKLFNNRFLLLAVVAGLLLHLTPFIVSPIGKFLSITSLNLRDWYLVILMSFFTILLIEITKFVLPTLHKWRVLLFRNK